MSVSAISHALPAMPARPPEAAEKGPDHDGDADDKGVKAVQPALPSGTGTAVNTVA